MVEWSKFNTVHCVMSRYFNINKCTAVAHNNSLLPVSVMLHISVLLTDHQQA